MADNVTLPGTGANVATDELDILNSVTQTGTKPEAQRIKLLHGADGEGTDASLVDPFPVVLPTKAVAETPAGAATVGTSSAILLDLNGSRWESTFWNDHPSNVVYLAVGPTASLNTGARLNPGGGSYTTPPGYTGEVSAVSTGAGTNVTYTEV